MQLTVDFQYSDMSGQELRLDSRRELAGHQLASAAPLPSFRLRELSDRAQASGQNSDQISARNSASNSRGQALCGWLRWPMRASAVPVTRSHSKGRGKLGTSKNSAQSH